MPNEQNGQREERTFAGEQLREPELSYYLALRAQWQAAKTRQETWEHALQVFHVELWARYGLAPEDGIDPRGRITRAPRAEPARDPDDILLPAGITPEEMQR